MDADEKSVTATIISGHGYTHAFTQLTDVG